MFIRESKTKNKKTGKVYIKHSLAQSVRTERGPRQRIVLTLGSLSVDYEKLGVNNPLKDQLIKM